MTNTNDKDNLILEVTDLKMYFPLYAGITQRHAGNVKAVDGVSFFLREGEVLGLVGESGCGKTTVGRTILRLYDPTSGEVRFRRKSGEWVDIARISQKDMKPLRQEMRMIFQDPFSSLNPRMTVKDLIAEPLEIHGIAKGKEAEERVAELMTSVGLNPSYMHRYPHEFSGGQRQRIGLARTLSLNPRLVVADEPVSALDVSVQAQVLNLLQELKEQAGADADFRRARSLGGRAYFRPDGGDVCRQDRGDWPTTEALLNKPLHPYTEALLSAIPPADPDVKQERIKLQGEVPSPANPPSGCIFHPRCNYAKDRCKSEVPPLLEVEPGHFVSCHFAKELQLKGIETAVGG